ncbi:MAG: hypothetical protein QY326_08670 [Bdellovibrionota bacterium]|nr:MAG: hypothetical protein QY326_08670 [Bdellovibrionota bacterium]
MPDPTTIHRDPGPAVPDPQRLESERSPYTPQQFFEPNVVHGLDQVDSYLQKLVQYLARMGAPPETLRVIEEHRRILNQELVTLRDSIEKTLQSDPRLDHKHKGYSYEADIGGRMAELLQRLDPDERADLLRVIEQHPGITPQEKEIVRRALQGGADSLTAQEAAVLYLVLESADVSASIGKIILHHEIGDRALRDRIARSLEIIRNEVGALCQSLIDISHALQGSIAVFLETGPAAWQGVDPALSRALTITHPAEAASASVIAGILIGIAAELEGQLKKQVEEDAQRSEELKRRALAEVERILSIYPELLNLAGTQSLRQGDYTYGPSPNDLAQLMALGRELRSNSEDSSNVLQGAFGRG